MAKKSGDGKRNENPPPRTSPRVQHEAGQKTRSGSKVERELGASVLRHIEPRRPGKR